MDENPDIPIQPRESQLRRPRNYFFLRLIFGLSVIGFLAWKTDVSRLVSSLSRVDPFWLGLAFLVQIIGKFIWTARWSILLDVFEIRVPFRRLLAGLMVGLFFNNFLPSSMGGDFYRGYWILDNKSLYRKSLFIIFIERIIGFATLGYIALPAIPFIILYGFDLGATRWWLALCMLVLCASILLLDPRFFNRVNSLLFRLGVNFFEDIRKKVLRSLVVLHKSSDRKPWLYLF
jgi:uncharacterized protein (TIRG00374 family)